MSGTNKYATFLIVFMIVVVVLSAVSMVFAAKAADAAKDKSTCPGPSNKCQKECHKYSIWSAVSIGATITALIIILILFFYYKNTRDVAVKGVGEFRDDVKGAADSIANQIREEISRQLSSASSYVQPQRSLQAPY